MTAHRSPAAAPAVLIAEDGASYRRQIVSLLEPLALPCLAAENGRQAIRVLEDRSRELLLVVTDLDMPDANGWDVVRAAREHRDGLPIIMQTGQAQFAHVWARARDLGVVLIDKLDVPARLLPVAQELLDR